MDLTKIEVIFDPNDITDQINIIGCGSVGSTVAELLARYGLTNFTLWDMDTVEEKNIVNQMFFQADVNKPKVEAVANLICAINPDAKDNIIVKPDGWQGEQVRGYVFLAVDNIEIRKDFMEKNKYNPYIKGVFDIRTGLYDAQCISADWTDDAMVENLKNSMAFSHEEAASNTPVSACGVTQGLAPTVRFICCLAVTNFIGFATGKAELSKVITANPYRLNKKANIVTAL